jgi:site-specific DNA recombinase
MEISYNKKKRVAIYTRVSTDEQLKGYGLAFQEEKLRDFARSQDYSLDEKHIYRDEGFSGALMASERPNMTRLFEAASRKEFDIVLVYKFDRLFRKTRLFLESIEKLEQYGVGFKSITEPFDNTHSSGKFMFTMLAGVAEMERDTIRERTMNGRAAAARDGKWVTGVPPYGYTLDKGKKQLHIQEDEAKWVKMFFNWVVKEKLPLREIQRRANDMKIPVPRHKVSDKKTLNFWHKRTIGRILTNETYTGTAHFRKYKRPFNNLTSITDKSMLRPKDEWIPIKVPAVVSLQLFEECKGQLLKNREFATRNQKRTYLFSKIIYCGTCGFKLFGGYQPSKKGAAKEGVKYYHGLSSKVKVGQTMRCEVCSQISERRLYPVWDKLVEVLKNPQFTLNKLRRYNNRDVDKREIREQLGQMEKAINELEEKRYRSSQVYTEGEIDYQQYQQYLQECRDQEQRLKEEKLRLEQKITSKKDLSHISNLIQAQYKYLVERIDNLSYEEKQKVLRIIVKKIIVYPKIGEAEVEVNFSNNKDKASEEADKSSILRDSYAKNSPAISTSLMIKMPVLSEKERRSEIWNATFGKRGQ